ncbi:glycosyltransferase family 39 protein [Coleofasciculus sp. H7-2]|uniref:glycosyltransferase family 39 protein n=1 Tax=Coleofasciculus sp. H7-2 TaxID=3351545 RepID=UPI0036718156
MDNQLKLTWALPPTWLRFLIIVLLVLGVFFRFVNLDKKVYWYDETLTSLTISGFTKDELYQQVFNGSEVGVEDLLKYQYPNPEKGLIDTVSSLSLDSPEHPPFYFIMARFWVQLFGNSVAVTRSLSAVISLLAFPCIYWLCLELFESPLVGWIAIALIAVSPFHVLYAQEAREYSLWIVTILLSSAALLQAIRLKTKIGWVIYAVTVVVSLYTYLFSALVLIGHGLYVAITASWRLNKTTLSYLFASVVGVVIFTPWFFFILAHHSSMSWTAEKISWLDMVKIWVLNLIHVFLDIKFNLNNPLTYLIPFILILVGYSIYFLYRNATKQAFVFIFTLMGVTALALLLPDIIKGGRWSSVARYLTPFYLGIQIAVVYLLANKIKFYVNNKQRKIGRVAIILLFSCGVLSCATSSQAEGWWNKFHNSQNAQIARMINQADSPLVISDSSHGDILSLSHLLDNKVRFQLVIEPKIPKIVDGFSDTFLFSPSKTLLSGLQINHNDTIKPIYKRKLWKVVKN